MSRLEEDAGNAALAGEGRREALVDTGEPGSISAVGGEEVSTVARRFGGFLYSNAWEGERQEAKCLRGKVRASRKCIVRLTPVVFHSLPLTNGAHQEGPTQKPHTKVIGATYWIVIIFLYFH